MSAEPENPVRVAIVSDTHGVLDARVREAIALAGARVIVHAGDIVGVDVLEELAGLADRVVAVRGNNDIPAKWGRGLRRLRALPLEAAVELPGGILWVVHGDRVNPASRRHALLRRKYPEARAIVYGHSHRLVIDRAEKPWVLNPGAAGGDRTHGGPSCLVLEATLRRWNIRVVRFLRV